MSCHWPGKDGDMPKKLPCSLTLAIRLLETMDSTPQNWNSLSNLMFEEETF